MKSAILKLLLSRLVTNLDSDKVKEFIDDILDRFEDNNAQTKLLVGVIRAVADIPDDIGGDED